MMIQVDSDITKMIRRTKGWKIRLEICIWCVYVCIPLGVRDLNSSPGLYTNILRHCFCVRNADGLLICRPPVARDVMNNKKYKKKNERRIKSTTTSIKHTKEWWTWAKDFVFQIPLHASKWMQKQKHEHAFFVCLCYIYILILWWNLYGIFILFLFSFHFHHSPLTRWLGRLVRNAINVLELCANAFARTSRDINRASPVTFRMRIFDGVSAIPKYREKHIKYSALRAK